MKYYLGWDASGWKHDGDALCFIPAEDDPLLCLRKAGFFPSSRGNSQCKVTGQSVLSKWCLQREAWTYEDFLDTLGLRSGSAEHVTLAVDCPLGIPRDFARLFRLDERVTTSRSTSQPCIENTYLYRATERGLSPSARPLPGLASFLGHVVTKVRHVLSSFGLKVAGPGVFEAFDSRLTVIECYPGILKVGHDSKSVESLMSFDGAEISAMVQEFDRRCDRSCDQSTSRKIQPLTSGDRKWQNNDLLDAIICAHVARWFDRNKAHSSVPEACADAAKSEGWIWIPK